MGDLEQARYSEVVRRIDRLRARFREVSMRWELVNEERRDVRAELLQLQDEAAMLEQGQLFFDEPA